MESHELELQATQGDGRPVEASDAEDCSDATLIGEEHGWPSQLSTGLSSLGRCTDVCVTEASGQDAAGREAGPQEGAGGQADALGVEEHDSPPQQQSTGTNACATDGEEHRSDSQQSISPWSLGTSGNACAAAANGSSAEEDETQLAAIRELMQRSFARGIWLTLGEIAEVTEFAEASISAQLRHLRKPRHGGHRVEKRRRRPRGAAVAAPKIWDARRGPVIWEYRVLPATHARGIEAEGRTPCLNA